MSHTQRFTLYWCFPCFHFTNYTRTECNFAPKNTNSRSSASQYQRPRFPPLFTFTECIKSFGTSGDVFVRLKQIVLCGNYILPGLLNPTIDCSRLVGQISQHEVSSSVPGCKNCKITCPLDVSSTSTWWSRSAPWYEILSSTLQAFRLYSCRREHPSKGLVLFAVFGCAVRKKLNRGNDGALRNLGKLPRLA